jgi:hypothetical protein
MCGICGGDHRTDQCDASEADIKAAGYVPIDSQVRQMMGTASFVCIKNQWYAQPSFMPQACD